MVWIFVISLLLSALSKSNSEFVENPKFTVGLIYPETTTIGYLVVIAVPLDLKDQSVYLSFGFEEYYSLPSKSYHWFPSSADHFADRKARSDNLAEVYSSIVTRKRVYDLIERKLEMFGISGKECLLRTICEVSSAPLAEHNGVIGDILQIMLMPSKTQNDDDLDPEYYAAESNGHNHNCQTYHEDCPISLLDIFSKEFFI